MRLREEFVEAEGEVFVADEKEEVPVVVLQVLQLV